MRLTLWYEGQPLGEVEFGAPNPQGLHLGTLRPNANYHAVRPRLQRAFLGLSELKNAPPAEIRAYLLRSEAELGADGLMLGNAAGEPVPTSFLQVTDAFPPETAPEVLEMIGIQVGARLTPAT